MPDRLNGIVFATLARDHSKISQSLHGKQLAIQNLLQPRWIGQIVLGHVHFGHDKDCSLPTRIDLGYEVCDYAALRIDRSILNAQNDGIRIANERK